ncbi:MarR family transcriptional regulator [Streptomyces sp. NPDC005968]|uniref:MarR family winged helix-turn-helix transcriptional regulator n=1 Tax=Streptomyces sp. NPDC005968 TaxID=3154574 RepID=UPI00340E43DF
MNGPTVATQRWHALDLLHRQVEARIEKELYRELGISSREYRALIALGERTPPRQQLIRVIVEATGLSSSATSRLLTRLHERGMITVQAGSRDRRTLDVQLTTKADGLIREGGPILERITAAAIASLDPSETDSHLLQFLEG